MGGKETTITNRKWRRGEPLPEPTLYRDDTRASKKTKKKNKRKREKQRRAIVTNRHEFDDGVTHRLLLASYMHIKLPFESKHAHWQHQILFEQNHNENNNDDDDNSSRPKEPHSRWLLWFPTHSAV